MKKAKKQRLNNIWSKIKKPLMILSIVGNILFLIFIIVGCVGTHKKATQTKAEDTISTLLDTTWVFNDEVYIDYYVSETYNVNFTSNNEVFIAIFLYDNGDDLNYMRFGWQTGSVDVTDFGEWVQPQYKQVTFTGGNDISNSSLIEFMQTYATLQGGEDGDDSESIISQRFTFDKYFNYNAPFAMNSNSMFVNEPHTQKTYDFPLFVSNGEYFNRIKLYYVDGNGTLYETSSGTSTNNNTGTGYYLYMEYINTSTSTSVVVNNRSFKSDYTSASGSASVQTYLVKGSYWLNDSYRYLGFYTTLTPEQLNSLAQFNSEFDENGFSNGTTNVGLGNVFTLLSNAFASFTNIFKIEILPNITIGLLLFLPLIVIVIIVIIKLVKR